MSAVDSEQTVPRTSPRLPEELVASTAFLLKRLGFLAKEKGQRAYEDTGLGPYHHAVLIALDEDTHETQGAIADTLGYDHGQLVGLLDELEERGFVERRRDPKDRRRQLVSMTADGKRALGRFRALARGLEEDLLTPLEESERERLHTLLLRLAEHHLPQCGRNAPTSR